MKIASILENQKIEKRIAITPEIAKKYISLGLEVSLSENYGSHLGIKDEEFKNIHNNFAEMASQNWINLQGLVPFSSSFVIEAKKA